MKKLFLALVFVLIAAASGQAQTYQKDIIGTWKVDIDDFMEVNKISVNEHQKPYVVKSLEKKFKNFSMVFTADGMVTVTSDDKNTYKYKIKGNAITFNNNTATIKKLDKNSFVFERDGKHMSLKKVH